MQSQPGTFAREGGPVRGNSGINTQSDYYAWAVGGLWDSTLPLASVSGLWRRVGAGCPQFPNGARRRGWRVAWTWGSGVARSTYIKL